MSDNLFEQLNGLRQQTVPIALQSGTRQANPNYDARDPESRPYFTSPTTGTAPIQFMIHPISADEIAEADMMITELPPTEFQEQPSPGRVGTVQARIGPMYDDPAYLAAKQKQIPHRDAAICLFGCPALGETTPGITLKDKIQNLTSKVPAAILEWLAREIGDISIITAVGEKEVASFLANASTATGGNTSKPTKTASSAPRKKN